ncbi:hypothetical protein A2U01_0045932, partial [Trifolium medium]|nr:hypothetical protein [Trifolium medium]
MSGATYPLHHRCPDRRRWFCAPIALPSSDLPCTAIWFNQHRLPRGGGSWFVVVTPSLRRPKLSHVFQTSRRRPLARRHFRSCRILAVLLRVGGLGSFSNRAQCCYAHVVCWFIVHNFVAVLGSLGSGCSD